MAYTYDALGRTASQTPSGGGTTTYRYLGTGLATYGTVGDPGLPVTYALVGADGSRVALDTDGVSAWSLFDLHGNFAGAQAETGTTIVNAVRYDAYGQVIDTFTGAAGTDTPWRFQGRLDLSTDADNPLYDFGARRYSPGIGTFTQLDTYAGSAQNPLSMNRFLYAHANPVTLIDPDGHAVAPPMIDGQCVAKACASIKPIQSGAGPSVQPTYTSASSSSGSTYVPAAGSSYVPTISAGGGKASSRTPWRSVTSVYTPNPLKLSSVGLAYDTMTPSQRLGRTLAAFEAAPEIETISPETAVLFVFAAPLAVEGGAIAAGAALTMRASGAAAACAQYCYRALQLLLGVGEGLANAPSSGIVAGGAGQVVHGAGSGAIATRPVFWSGSHAARRAAEEFANATGGATLGQTSVGRQLAGLTADLDYLTQGRPLWSRASRDFAETASGTVDVFQAPAVRTDSIWALDEYKVLVDRGVQINYHVVVEDGRVFTVR